MPITADELLDRGKHGLDYFLKNNPIDQVSSQKPFLKAMSAKKKTFGGAKEVIVEQLRTAYGSNGSWFSGAGTLTYTKRRSIDQTKFPWYQFHDGLALDEDRLIANGINIAESVQTTNMSNAEKIQLTNLMEEQMTVLREGAQDRFSRDIQMNGGGNADQIVGLDGLLPLDNATGTVGGIDRAAKTWWRHYVDKTMDVATLEAKMEKGWRECIKRSNGTPDVILAGSDFIDAYSEATKTTGVAGGAVRVVQTDGKGGVTGDIGTTGLYYKGVPIQYCPEWDDNFGGADTTTSPWAKRCYFINTRHMTLRPIEGNDFVTRKPPRDKEAYTFYWALLWRGALTMNMAQAHAVFALA